MQYTCRMLPYTTIPYTTYTTFWKQPMSPGEFCHQRSFFCLQELFDCLGPRFCGQLLGDLGEVGSCDARQTNKMTSFDDMHKIQTGYTTHMYIHYIYIYTHYIYTIFYIVEMIELYRELLTQHNLCFFPMRYCLASCVARGRTLLRTVRCSKRYSSQFLSLSTSSQFFPSVSHHFSGIKIPSYKNSCAI